MSFHITLVEPEIPSNTGNIGRTCVATNSKLQLVKPLGFKLEDKNLKRAGLDYWPHLKWEVFEGFEEWKKKAKLERAFFFSVRGKKSLYECEIKKGDFLVFGKETKGLDPKILKEFEEQSVRIPFSGPVRSLNLANAVSIALFEALRQSSQSRELF